MACGYASYDPALDRTVRDVIRRSDSMMYENKKKKEPLWTAPEEFLRNAERPAML